MRHPICHMPGFFLSQILEDKLRVLSLPGDCFSFIQREPQHFLMVGNQVSKLLEHGVFCLCDLRYDLLTGPHAGIREIRE